MPSTYQLKSRFQSLLRPLAACLYRAGVTANQITVGACLISVAIGAWTLHGAHRNAMFLLIAFWCPLRMAANALDGMLAREYGQASRRGALLNELGDVMSDIALYLPFAWVAGSQPWLVMTIIVLAVCSESAGWLGTAINHARANHGPMGKSDRALAFGIIALLIGCGVPVEPFINTLWLGIAVLLLLTIVNRARFVCAVKNAGDTH
jgi:CDP-diacylglycerol--glycerol-3-phosphate 3-phosphatidyltransferase